MAGSVRASRGREKSPSSTPLPSTEQAEQAEPEAEAAGPPSDGSQIPAAEWEAMQKVLNHIYEYRTADGTDPSILFHRKVNKRVIPEYYDTIKEPIALSTIKQKIHKKLYQNFREFVRDFALIPHNAQLFNIPESGAFQDALIVKEQIEKQLQMLVADGLITQEIATLPDLGEIPTYVPAPPVEEVAEPEAEDEEESDDDAEDDDDDDGDEDEDGRKKKRRSTKGASKREADDMEGGKRSRGRPPKLLTPMEARMQTILKGIRKPRVKGSQLMIRDFDRLPDKTAMPGYYTEIKNPMAYDQLKRKVKRKKYKTLEEFMADVKLMFNNAKEFNKDDSQIYKNAVALLAEANKLYEEESAKPDESFADDEGKIPLPNGILHNGELYKVGDWVHIQNPNDLTKPIPAQIYRTYRASNGQNMVNVCWYYRPEQTVHRFDKHFFQSEVVKTGRYRDHNIEQVEGKCFIMFYTRFFKGRPRGLPDGTEVYVCQARYNEAAHQFNTIKTWASCLPDEVRDKDYEMDLFDHPRKMKKHPTSLAFMLKDEQKETDDFPKVQWGAEGAPPKVGAVHRRPRNEKDSPPPEPTPPPPPKIPTPQPRAIPPTPQTYTPAPAQQVTRAPTNAANYASYTPSHTPQYRQYTGPATTSPATQRPPTTSAMNYGQQPATPQHMQTASRPPALPTASSGYQSSSTALPPNPAAYAPRPTTASYRDPPPIEVYTLPDAANLSIPPEVRERYQRDEYGRVLFFTAPPVAAAQEGQVRGHSVRYLAEKARRAELIAKKRKERDTQKEEEEHAAKKARIEATQQNIFNIEALKRKAVQVLDKQLATAVSLELSDGDLQTLAAAQKAAVERKKMAEENERDRKAMRGISLNSSFYADDFDHRSVQ